MARRCLLLSFCGAVFCTLLSLAPGAACAAEERVGEHLYLVRDRAGTPTHFQMIVGAGCADEKDAMCRGLAHYLEHLVLTGRNAEHKDVALRLFPDGSSNGWTSQRATVYVHTMPAREEGPRADLEKLFGFYAARLKELAVGAADAERERSIVRQEHDWRVASRPFVRFARKLDRLLIPDHPSGQWVIGTTEDIDGLSLDEARDFHRVWYVLKNIDFVVLANIDAASLKEIAGRALVGSEPGSLPRRAIAKPPAVVIERIDVVEEDAAIKRAGVYFKKLVRIDEGDTYTAAAARSLITSFLTSRLPGSLYDALIDKGKLAAGTPSLVFGRIAPNTFTLTIGADTAPDVAPEELLAAISRYVEQLGASGIPAETLARIKKRIADGYAAGRDDPRQVYSRLTSWLAGRSRYDNLARWPSLIAAVPPEQVSTILQGMSGPGRVVTGMLTPAKVAP